MANGFRYSVLAVGTELTTGQILNRNAQWISQKMQGLGVHESQHLVVPDDRELILQALSYLEPQSEVLFVTGGLGPTSDDFTRELIAKWSGQSLQWDEKSWQFVQDTLQKRGVVVRESQKQQCYYPAGSRVLENSVGTAHGFQIQVRKTTVFVLPGPPRELQAIWTDHIQSQLLEMTQKLDLMRTDIWDCLGVGESEIAHLAEPVLKNTKTEIGYRVHYPYVELKVSYPQSRQAELAPTLQTLTETLGNHVALRHGQDAAELLSQKLSKAKSICIQDEVSGSHLITRLFPFAKNLLDQKKLHFMTDTNSNCEIQLRLSHTSPGHAKAEIIRQGHKRSQHFSTPYGKLSMTERQNQYFAEMALLFWLQEI